MRPLDPLPVASSWLWAQNYIRESSPHRDSHENRQGLSLSSRDPSSDLWTLPFPDLDDKDVQRTLSLHSAHHPLTLLQQPSSSVGLRNQGPCLGFKFTVSRRGSVPEMHSWFVFLGRRRDTRALPSLL